jgi:outer membrane protein assembly factor BamB
MTMALVVVLGMSTSVRAEDWPWWLGPRRDNSTVDKVTPWKGELKLLWKQLAGEGNGTPVVADGRVFVHSKVKDKNAEVLDVFDAETGKPLWSQPYDRPMFSSPYGNGPRATPAVVGGKVYTNGITGLLTCFNAKNGDILWQVDTLKEYKAKNLFFGRASSPLIDGDSIYLNVGGPGAGVVAFDKDTGKERWKAGNDPASYASPTLFEFNGQRELVFLTGTNLLAVDPKDGKELWKFPFKDYIFESSVTPARIGDIVIGSSITLGTVGLKLDSPDKVKKAWLDTGLTGYFSTPVAVGKHLYLVTGTKPPSVSPSATLYCLDPTGGKQLWKRENVGTYHACLTRTGDDKLLLLEEGGDLVLFDADPKEYRELARAKVCGDTWAHPAIAGGRLYLRDKREIRCVELPK